MNSNIIKYYLFSLFIRLTFFNSFLIVFFTTKGLTLTEVMVIQSFHSLGALLAEVPCGAFADKYEKKLSLIIGSFLWGLSLLFFGLGSGYLTFLIWSFIGGVGQAFMSGADAVLLKESLQTVNRQNEFRKIEGRSRSINTVAKIVATSVSGAIAAVSIALTFYLSAIAVFISTIIAFFFKRTKVDIDLHKQSILITIKSGFKTILKNKELLWLAVFLSFTNGVIWVGRSLTQPYLQEIDFPLKYFGLLFAGFGLLTALLSFNLHKFKISHSREFLLIILGMCSISTLFLGVVPGILIFMTWSVAEITTVIIPFLVSARTLEISKESESTTILSFQSLFVRIVNIVVSPLIGLVATHAGIFMSFKVMGAFLGGLCLLLYFFNTKIIKK